MVATGAAIPLTPPTGDQVPDLSHRPTRYFCAAATAAALGAATVTSLDVRIGPDPALVTAREHVTALEAQVASLRADLATDRADGRSDDAGESDEPAGGDATQAPRCDVYPDQETAQVAFVADPLALADLDGDGDGRACEQLRSEEPARAWGGTPPTRRAEQPVPASWTPSTSASAPTTSSTSSTSTTVAPALPPLPVAPSKSELVASTGHFGLAAATTEEYDRLEWRLATDTTMRAYYTGFDTDFDQQRVIGSWRRGEIPMLTWESRSLAGLGVEVDASLSRIAEGELDEYLVRYATDIAELGLPVVIRFDHEMNGDWYRWSESKPSYGNPPGSYVAAWRHIHEVFESVGANEQVIWVWSPNRVDNIGRLPSIDRYWPGDDYVDWVGMTGYMRPSDTPADFATIYDATLSELRRVAPDTPILLSEIGATERNGAKIPFIESFFPGLADNPDVIGFVWFNYAISEDGNTNDWRIDSTEATFQAFREGLRASPFGDTWRDGMPDSATATVPITTTTTGTPVTTSSTSSTTTSTTSTSQPATTTTQPAPTTTTTARDAATDPSIEVPEPMSAPSVGGDE
jgi:hypothetical protein